MDTSTMLIIILIYLTFFIINLFIQDFNTRLAYWFIIALGTLAFMNLYLSVLYYIRLRNEPGEPGSRGEKGLQGANGDIGKCTFSEKCGINDCRGKIFGLGEKFYPDIPLKCLKNTKKCRSHTEREKAIPVNKELKRLIERCNKTKMAEEDFMRRITPLIENMEQTGQ
jgi:hypothetical protein